MARTELEDPEVYKLSGRLTDGIPTAVSRWVPPTMDAGREADEHD
jgi:hypothetical protein